MSEQQSAQANGKLYACRLLLQQLDGLTDASPAALRNALCEAAVLQLVVGYRLYLREIAAAYRYRGACDNARELRAGLQAEGRDSAEVYELFQAEREGVLAGLLDAWQVLNLQAPPSQSAPSAAELLVRTGFRDLDPAQCRGWLDGLRDLIKRQREHLQEW